MTPRDRIVAALNFKPTDRLPKDLGGMRSTGISAFTYQGLRKELGLPAKPTRVYDTGQMLALPHVDVLDALGCDVVIVEGDGLTNGYEQEELWHPYEFNGRIPNAQVRQAEKYTVEAEGTIRLGNMTMPLGSNVFDSEHAGQILVLDGELPRPNLKEVKANLEKNLWTEARIKALRQTCRRVRESTERAVFLWGPTSLGLCIHGHGGVAVFPVLCLEDPAFIHELHAMHLEYAMKDLRAILPEIKDYVDIVSTDADDWGNQNSLMASPSTFRDLFLPYRKQHNAEIHRLAPVVKTFLHSCGALYNILDMLVETGTDILNPVQWPAGGHSAREWKDKVSGKMSLWGGAVDSQHTMPTGTVGQIQQEARESARVLGEGAGYVFANIHNFLAEIAPEKVVALYRAIL